LITGYGKVGFLKQAMSLFQNLQNVRLKPDEATYRSMMEGCGKTGKLKEALWYYNEMKTNGFHPSSLNLKTIINLLAKSV
jgi:pentatricopeptide repeat protein